MLFDDGKSDEDDARKTLTSQFTSLAVLSMMRTIRWFWQGPEWP